MPDSQRRFTVPPAARHSHQDHSQWGAGHVLGCLAVCAFLAVAITGALFLAVSEDAEEFWEVLNEQPPERVPAESNDQRVAWLRQGFAATPIDIAPQDEADIRAMLDIIVTAQETDQPELFSEKVDYEAMADKVMHSHEMTTFSPGLAAEMPDNLRSDGGFGPPVKGVYYQLRSIEELSDNRFLAYAHFWDDNDEIFEFRYWIERQPTGMMFYDWEAVRAGLTTADKNARFQSTVSWGRVAEGAYDDIDIAVTSSREQVRAGEHDRAISTLDEVRLLVGLVPARYRDERLCRLALARGCAGDWDGAASLARQIRDPVQYPTAYYVQIWHARDNAQPKEMLRHCDAYEAAVGPTPVADRYRADAYEQLGQHNVAAGQWLQYLQKDPGHHGAFTEYARLVSDPQLEIIAPLLEAFDDPQAAVVTATQSAFWRVDLDLAELFSEYVERWPADASARCYVQGMTHELHLHDELATKLYRRGFEGKDPEEETYDTACWEAYLRLMASLNRLAEGYANVPDKRQAFRYLDGFDSYDDSSLDNEDLRELIAVHEQQDPDDPWMLLRKAQLSLADNDPIAAQATLKQAREAPIEADDDDQTEYLGDALHYELCKVSVELGTWRDVSLSAKDRDETFQTLANMMDLAVMPVELSALVEMHRDSHPDSPWVDFYAGKVAVLTHNANEAERLARRAFDAAEEQELDLYLFQSFLVDVLARRKKFEDALRTVEPIEETMAALVSYVERCGCNGCRNTLSEATIATKDSKELYEMALPSYKYYATSQSWEFADWKICLRDSLNYGVSRPANLDEWQLSRMSGWGVRSAIRLSSFDEARTILDAMPPGDRPDLANLLLVMQSPPEEILARFRAGELSESDVQSLYAADDARDRLWSAEFAKLREAVPPRLPWTLSESTVALLEHPISIELAEIEAAVKQVKQFSETATVAPLTTISLERPFQFRDGVTTFVIHDEGATILVTLGQQRYFDGNMQREFDLRQQAIVDACESHTGWLAVETIDEINPLQAGIRRRKLADALIKSQSFLQNIDNALAFYDSNSWQIVDAQHEVGTDRFLTRNDLHAWDRWGEDASLRRYQGSAMQSWALQRFNRLRQHTLAEYAAMPSPLPVRLVVDLNTTHAYETLELDLESARKTKGSWELLARLKSDSRMLSHLKAGQTLRLSPYQVVDWVETGGVRDHSLLAETLVWAREHFPDDPLFQRLKDRANE